MLVFLPSYTHETRVTPAITSSQRLDRARAIPLNASGLCLRIVFMLGTILIILLVLFLVGALPTWGHSRNWGYGPSGLLGTILVIVVILVLLHYI